MTCVSSLWEPTHADSNKGFILLLCQLQKVMLVRTELSNSMSPGTDFLALATNAMMKPTRVVKREMIITARWTCVSSSNTVNVACLFVHMHVCKHTFGKWLLCYINDITTKQCIWSSYLTIPCLHISNNIHLTLLLGTIILPPSNQTPIADYNANYW